MVALESLAQVFAQVPDPRKPRGVRHPIPSILTLVFLGLLARIRELAVLQRWAEAHWDQLRDPFGFDPDRDPPHATTISRAIAECDLGRFASALTTWMQQVLPEQPLTVAVDAKTSKQGLDADGDPVQLVTVFVHELKLTLAQWSVRGEKTNEPGVLKNHLNELLADFPLLKLITGDAIYAQRSLADALADENCDYLAQIKGNQPDVRPQPRSLTPPARSDYPNAVNRFSPKSSLLHSRRRRTRAGATLQTRLHARRTARRDRDHRHPRRALVAGGAGRARVGAPDSMHE